MYNPVPSVVVLGLLAEPETSQKTKKTSALVHAIGESTLTHMMDGTLVDYLEREWNGSVRESADWPGKTVIEVPTKKNLWYVGSTIAQELHNNFFPHHVTVLPYAYKDAYSWWKNVEQFSEPLLTHGGDIRYLNIFEETMEAYWTEFGDAVMMRDVEKIHQAYSTIMYLEPRTQENGALIRDILKTEKLDEFLLARNEEVDKPEEKYCEEDRSHL